MDMRERVARELFAIDIKDASTDFLSWKDVVRERVDMEYLADADRLLAIMGEDARRLDWLEDATGGPDVAIVTGMARCAGSTPISGRCLRDRAARTPEGRRAANGAQAGIPAPRNVGGSASLRYRTECAGRQASEHGGGVAEDHRAVAAEARVSTACHRELELVRGRVAAQWLRGVGAPVSDTPKASAPDREDGEE